MDITKASGEKEAFAREKFCDSLRNAGAQEDMVSKVCALVEEGLEPGMSTSEIFRKASAHLAKQNLAIASRYSLKKGIYELGPAGFLFEQFVETILQAEGFSTERNVIMQGHCIEHEVDVVGKRESEHFLIEAKYHNRGGIKTHVDVVMYAQARLEDITEKKEDEGTKNEHGMWLFTNTKFTHTAIKYATCRNIKLTGWSYSKGESLQDLVTKYSLYPITVLPGMDRDSREALARHNVMLARDLAPHSADDLVSQFGVHHSRAEKIVREAHELVYGNAN